MPGLNAVLKAWHVMLGRDLHIPWPPGAPAPAPAPVPYVTTMMMMGVVTLTVRMTVDVFTDGMAPAMVRGTDIGPMIPHLGPPSITIPIEMLFSGSKSYFGSSQYHVKDQYGASGNLACAAMGFTNPNLNCGTPAPTPFGLVIAPTTHMVTMTVGDMIAGMVMMAFDYVLQRAMYILGSMGSEWLASKTAAIGERLGITALGRTAARQAARALGYRSNIGPMANKLRAEAAKPLLKLAERLTIYGFTPVGFVLGSPLGMSVSNVRDSDGNQVLASVSDRYGNAANPEGVGDALGQKADNALNNYFNSPSVEDAGDGGAGGAPNVANDGASPSQSGLSPDGGAPSDGGEPPGGAAGAPSATDAGAAPGEGGVSPGEGPAAGESNMSPGEGSTAGESNISPAQEPAAGDGNMSPGDGSSAGGSNMSSPDGPTSASPALSPSASTPAEPNASGLDGSDTGDAGGDGPEGSGR